MNLFFILRQALAHFIVFLTLFFVAPFFILLIHEGLTLASMSKLVGPSLAFSLVLSPAVTLVLAVDELVHLRKKSGIRDRN